MTRTRLGLAASAFFAAGTLFYPATIQAQVPAGSSARQIPTEVQKAEPRIDQVIERANDHFRKGKLNLEDNKREQARDEFDKAIDEILMSGLDVRASQRLQTFYLELVERIYREEVPVLQVMPQQNAQPVVAQGAPNQQTDSVEVAKVQEPKPVQIGFVQQEFVPGRDPLSKLILTEEEQKVSSE
jgi:membrane-bound lytic murein transglycosylase D